MYKKLVLATLAIFAIVYGSYAQEYKNEFGFKSDNDAYLWYGQDRYYTNGLFVYFRRALDQQKIKGNLEKATYEISAGQKMFNPISGYRPDPATHDRPFAAYLYGGVQASIFYKNESLLKVGVNLGTVGPGALGEEAQDLLHSIVGFYEVQGWNYQITNDFAANANAQYAKLLHRSSDKVVDFTLDTYANVGTTYNGAGLGVVFRAGDINQLFNSSHYNAAISNKNKTEKLKKKEFYFYAKPQLNYVAYDATVQGSLFNENSPVTFDVKPLVFSQTLGFNYSSPRFTIDYSVIFLTKEIRSTAKAHQYGSISMYYRFN
ncbi:lipid A deacylase LpxR family protein [Pedobacter helvus]|uniref:Lipid A deacylase LpxR family protein n=1 Tax=Pedobacter helvus TaxID=2563444 RepID=A0ABW9JFM3_9SPHI|nr:lipid A deacylase LpxR family protein [Pedobacter ureilyticus]